MNKSTLERTRQMPKPSNPALAKRKTITKRPGSVKPPPSTKPTKTVKTTSTKGKVQLLQGDCNAHMEKMGIMQYDLTFADPPFNIGHDYQGFDDSKPGAEFKAFNQKWVSNVLRVTKSIVCLYGNDVLADQYLHIMRRYPGFHRIAWVIWHYRFGQCQQTTWIPSKCHLLVYCRYRSGWTWNRDAIAVESDRKAIYKDKRINDFEKGGNRPPFDVWGGDISTFAEGELLKGDGQYWGRVPGNSEERGENNPNQLPEVFMGRIIKAYTNPGDLILDPFAGYATTAVVAQALGRNCVTIELSKPNYEACQSRLKKGSVRFKV